MRLYISMLVFTHLDNTFVSTCAEEAERWSLPASRSSATKAVTGRNSSSRLPSSALSSSSSSSSVSHLATERIREFLAASKQIEYRLRLSRESLFPSKSWKQDFVKELWLRPYYKISSSSFAEPKEMDLCCVVCNSDSSNTVTAATQKVHLYGPRYSGDGVLMLTRWDREMPAEAFYCSAGNGNGNGSGNSKGKGKSDGSGNCSQDALIGDESCWAVCSDCVRRTQFYHMLIHHKFNLFEKIKGKLEEHEGDVERVLGDISFVSQEVDSFIELLEPGRDYSYHFKGRSVI